MRRYLDEGPHWNTFQNWCECVIELPFVVACMKMGEEVAGTENRVYVMLCKSTPDMYQWYGVMYAITTITGVMKGGTLCVTM